MKLSAAWMLNSISEHVVCTTLTGEPYKPGYEGFVDLSTKIMDGRNSKQQQQAVSGVLEALMPPNAPATFRKLFPFRQVLSFKAVKPQTIYSLWYCSNVPVLRPYVVPLYVCRPC